MFAWDASFSDYIAARPQQKKAKMASRHPKEKDAHAHVTLSHRDDDAATSEDEDGTYRDHWRELQHQQHSSLSDEDLGPVESGLSFSNSLPPYDGPSDLAGRPALSFTNSLPPYEGGEEGGREFGVYYFNAGHRDLLVTRNVRADATEGGFSEPVLRYDGMADTGKEKEEGSVKRPVYYADVSEFTRGKPAVTLHGLVGTAAGVSTFRSKAEITAKYGEKELESAPVGGVVRFPNFSRKMELGFASASAGIAGWSSAGALSDADMRWEELRPTSALNHARYEFGFRGRRYVWQRTKAGAEGVQGPAWRRSMALDNFKLVDITGREPRTLAVFVNSWHSWRKRGSLRILDPPADHNAGVFGSGDGKEGVASQDGADEMEVVIVLSCIGILEKARRRAIRRHSAGGGGG